jgi:hypothetical protein
MFRVEDKEILVLIVSCLAAVLAAGMLFPSLGLMGLFGGNPHDGPDGPLQDTIFLEQDDTSQAFPLWTTEFIVEGTRGETVYPVDELDFSVVGPADIEVTGLEFTYRDQDGDGFASPGDELRILNMTDDVNGADLQVFLGDDRVTIVGIWWDVNEPRIYSMFLSWVYPVEVNGSRWDTAFNVVHLHLPFDVNISDITFAVVGEGLVPIENAVVVVSDENEDGLLSDFDKVQVKGITEGYQRATVRMYLDGTTVAIGTIPQWIF